MGTESVNSVCYVIFDSVILVEFQTREINMPGLVVL